MELSKSQLERQDLVDNAIHAFMCSCNIPLTLQLKDLAFFLDIEDKLQILSRKYYKSARDILHPLDYMVILWLNYPDEFRAMKEAVINFRKNNGNNWSIEYISKFRNAIQTIFVELGVCTEMEFYPYLEEAKSQIPLEHEALDSGFKLGVSNTKGIVHTTFGKYECDFCHKHYENDSNACRIQRNPGTGFVVCLNCAQEIDDLVVKNEI